MLRTLICVFSFTFVIHGGAGLAGGVERTWRRSVVRLCGVSTLLVAEMRLGGDEFRRHC